MSELQERSTFSESDIRPIGHEIEELEKMHGEGRESNKELSPLETEIKELNDLEGILGNIPMTLQLKDQVNQREDEKGNLVDDPRVPLNEKMLGLIRKGRGHNLQGLDKKEIILHALDEGIITEKDLTDRVKNIDADLKDLENRLPSVVDEDEVISLVTAIHDKYFPSVEDKEKDKEGQATRTVKDWPE